MSDLTLGMLIKLAREPIEIPQEGDYYGLGRVRDIANNLFGTHFTFGGDTTIDVTPKEVTPKDDFTTKMKGMEQQGYEEATSGFGGPFKDLFKSTPDKYSKPINTNDPQELELQKAWDRGFQRGKRENVLDNREMAATLAQKTPYYVPQVIDYGAGKIRQGLNKLLGNSNFSFGADTFDDARSAGDYKRDLANHVAQTTNTNTPQGLRAMERTMGRLNQSPWAAGMSDYGDTHPESPVGPIGQILGGVEDIGNEAFVRGSLVNLGLMGAPGLSGLRPSLRVPAAAAVNTLVGVTPGVLNDVGVRVDPRVSLMTGTDYRANKEQRFRETYGDEVTNRLATQQYYGSYQDPQGNWQYFSGSEIDPTRLSEALPAFGDYQQYLNTFHINPANMDKEDVKLGYVMNRIGSGTPGTEIFWTPMYRTLSPENKANAFETWLSRRYMNSQSGMQKLVHGLDSNAAKLSTALMHDDTGVLQNGINTFFKTADVPTIVKFLDNNSGGPPGPAHYGDPDAMFNAVRTGMTQYMRNNPQDINDMFQDLIKLQQAQAIRDGADPGASSRGAQMIQTAFKDVLEDPETVHNMGAEDQVAFLDGYSKIKASKGGQVLLGDNADEAAQKIVQNFQAEVPGILTSHPELGPTLAASWARMNGMPETAAVIGNPWVFWIGVGGLLLGGAALAASVFDNDDDEEEEKELRRKLRALA